MFAALKKIKKDTLEKKLGADCKKIFQWELEILMGVNNCENVVKLIEVIWTESKYYLAFEYCSGGDLAGYIKKKGRIPSQKVWKFMQDIAHGLKYLKKKNVIHRDLKPGNFLLSDDSEYPTIKIADFGLAR